MKRVLLTGSTGRLGAAFLNHFKKDTRYRVTSLTRQEIDLTKPEKLKSELAAREFDILINPAAMSGLEECLDHPEQAKAINTESPAFMAQYCREKNAQFVHFSTDYVFSGKIEKRLTETDTPEPVNLYGKTKLAGESAVLSENPSALIARVSWLFGSSVSTRPCLINQVLHQLENGEAIELINDKFSLPTFTSDVVEWTLALLEKKSSGIYHLCNSGEPESWFSYAKKVTQLASKLGMQMPSPNVKAIALSDAGFFREQRPIHTAMIPLRLKEEKITSPRHWLDAAEEYLKSR